MEGPKGPGPDVKRRSPPPALTGMHRLPSRRPQGFQGSAACAPSATIATSSPFFSLSSVARAAAGCADVG